MQHTERSIVQDIAFFVALFATSLALGAALAHALELANKIGMTRDDYFIVQRIYAGWNQLAYLLAIQLIGIVSVMWLHRSDTRVFWPAAVALGCLVAAQAIFWIWTFPANQATSNWTVKPGDWSRLRWQWEYSHLAGAALQTIAMASLIIAVLRRGPLRSTGPMADR